MRLDETAQKIVVIHHSELQLKAMMIKLEEMHPHATILGDTPNVRLARTNGCFSSTHSSLHTMLKGADLVIFSGEGLEMFIHPLPH